MFKILSLTVLSFFICLFSLANDYEDAWKAISQKKYSEAKKLLQQATRQESSSFDAYLTLLYLQTYQGDETNIEGLVDKLSQTSDKNAYIYSLWFNGSLLGNYGKKKPHQLKLVNRIIDDPTFNGSIQSAAHYMKAMHFVFSNEFSKAREEWNSMGAIMDWQLAGPFENLSGSGYNVKNPPITVADPNASFTGLNNVKINWFTPPKLNREGWIFPYSHLPFNSAVVYAQSFVNASEDMKVILNVGGNGSIKAWVNDGLVLDESKERITELDYYKNYIHLKKGYNRILVQLAYTDNNQPNFIVRLTQDNLTPVKGVSATAQTQPYPKTTDALQTTSLKHFAEEFFERKIKEQPNNPLNYILLSQAYLRDEKITEARQVIENILHKDPNNTLLRFELLQTLSKAQNRTVLLQELDWLKENDPDSYINYVFRISNLIDEEKYVEADEEITKMISLYGEDENSLERKATVLGKMEKVDELVKLVNKGYEKYPENLSFVGMMFGVKKLITKDLKGAIGVYEKFLKNAYHFNVLKVLAQEYKDQGQNEKYLNLIKLVRSQSEHDPGFALTLSTYYYEKQNYAKALEYAKEALQLAPFSSTYWSQIALINEQLGNTAEAINSYRKAIYYDRTDYDARKKLITLEKKKDPLKFLPETDIYALVKKAKNEVENDYSYLLDEKGTIIHDEGASEEYISYVVKIYTQNGIDAWKESYISYSPSTQSLLVEKCEVIKPNGSKIQAERDDDHIVFTNLTIGDAIYVRYRVQNYTSGRLGKEFWDKFLFNSFAPSQTARYTLIVPKDFAFTHNTTGSKIEPMVKEESDFKIYTWEYKDLPALKKEPLMPPLNDVGTVLHLSTVKTWADIAQWYSDISYQNLTGNFELNAVYDEIFGDKKQLSDFEKAQRIYNYIEKNISYSSVSFRQSGLVPQNISKIITTRLGDCKDLSSLFVALATKAGLKSKLVLIDTRDNGTKDMVLPSMEFNHCIVTVKMNNKDYFIELTDNNLPFASLPTNLNGALGLIIPTHGEKTDGTLIRLSTPNRTIDKSIRNVSVVIKGKDEIITVHSVRYGNLTSGWRKDYATLLPEKQREVYQETVSNNYKNPVKLETLSFSGLHELQDSLIIDYSYSVKNEVVEAGSMKMLKVPFIDIIATLESISSDKREFPIEYWNYENTDVYETTVTIQLPAGQKFLEVPANQNFLFKKSTYSLKYIKEGDKLKVVRHVKLDREDILPADYQSFKKFFNDIVEAESQHVVFK